MEDCVVNLLGKVWNTILFIWAAFVGGTVGLMAIIFILLKEGFRSKKGGQRQSQIFLANKRRTILFYGVLSKIYDIINPFFYSNAMRKDMVELASIRQGFRVLDVGCGTGYTTEAILDRLTLGEVIGVDLTPSQLRRASRKLKRKNVVNFVRGDAENLPFKENAFNAVVSVGAIEYFPNPMRAIKEMARVVKQTGSVLVGAPELKWFRKARLDKSFYTPSAEELQGFYHEAGLKEVRVFLHGINSFLGTERYVVIAVGKK